MEVGAVICNGEMDKTKSLCYTLVVRDVATEFIFMFIIYVLSKFPPSPQTNINVCKFFLRTIQFDFSTR